ncbi:Ribosomal protein L11 methyltransferase (PrmA) [Musa troglodytarum]|uniref:ETFB lysine methyltransferase n=1 Tax=Musa troglodytarum TaxID=320322 RepID=A0A9E7H3G3_9LILI|nr:Ribosomal protein L11 methyltransferase (PrmA) [Musa troglodytarum]
MFGRLRHLRLLRYLSAVQIPIQPLPPIAVPPNSLSVAPTAAALKPIFCPRLFSLYHLRRRRPSERVPFCSRSTQTNEGAARAYLSVRIRCRKCDADMLSESLLCFGASSTSVDELSDSHDLDEISMQETFHPVEVTAGLWIVPKWREPPDLQATNIFLDPGMAFGTGEHPTTKLCLMLLCKLLHGGEQFLDYGTGSGILGIAAVKMGAASSIGIDIDPQAVISARQNIALNDMDSSKMLVYLAPSKTGSSCTDAETNMDPEERTLLNLELKSAKGKFDIIIANILLNPLLELAKDIVSYGKPGANIGLSGILSEQVQQIKEIYSQYLDDISVSEMEGWACLHGIRKENLTLISTRQKGRPHAALISTPPCKKRYFLVIAILVDLSADAVSSRRIRESGRPC